MLLRSMRRKYRKLSQLYWHYLYLVLNPPVLFGRTLSLAARKPNSL